MRPIKLAPIYIKWTKAITELDTLDWQLMDALRDVKGAEAKEYRTAVYRANQTLWTNYSAAMRRAQKDFEDK